MKTLFKKARLPNMKYTVLGFVLAVLCVLSLAVPSAISAAAQGATTKSSMTQSEPSAYAVRAPASRRLPLGQGHDLQNALGFARRGNYAEASSRLFQLSLDPRFANRRMQLRFLLGVVFYQMKMYQLAAFQFIDVIRDGNNPYVGRSLQKLSLAADALGDDTLLNYAISRIKVESFPMAHRDMLYYRIGEFQLHNQQYLDAIKSLNQVPPSSPKYDKALYMIALAYAENNQPKVAAKYFQELIDDREDRPVTDTTRVAALMGKARALYQAKDWADAIEAYRQVPRDSQYWHAMLFESSWAMFRDGRFRSAMSNFQSLHSPYFEDSYIPESLLLRSIVYLYICKYTEMDKTLGLFERLYRPVYNSLNSYLNQVDNPQQYFADQIKIMITASQVGFNPEHARFRIPYLVIRKVMKEGDFHRSLSYIKMLVRERHRVLSMPFSWRRGAIGRYAMMTLDRRFQRAREKAGREIRNHMLEVRADLVDLFEQEGFIRYEMLNSKKEYLKKLVAGKELPQTQINEKQSRDYYVQNGYQYWPFRGEYWLDELGDYFYLGTSSCN